MPNEPSSARLPARPSLEHLQKRAKRLAREQKIRLTQAQWRLAQHYGFKDWPALVAEVQARARSPLSRAALAGDEAEVRRLLNAGAPVDGGPREWDTPLFLACGSEAPAETRIVIARMLIEAGAFTRRGCTGGATALHAAARRGPGALVELLLRHGALFWQGDHEARRAHDYAHDYDKDSDPIDRERILYLTADGPKIEDPQFRAAVTAIQTGDVAQLTRLLDARPGLLTEPAIEPDLGPRGYFSDPMLFWFVANNPTLIPASPPNIVEVTKLMIGRGVAQRDLDYTLGLVCTDGLSTRQRQIDLARTLLEAGARVGQSGITSVLGHRQTEVVAWMLDHGHLQLDAVIAAALGRTAQLPKLLATAPAGQRADALGMAVINRQLEAARLCLEAGAEPNRFLACHSHSTALHQATCNNDVEMMKLLIAQGARRDIKDTLWHGTVLGWAYHCKAKDAEAYLRSLGDLPPG